MQDGKPEGELQYLVQGEHLKVLITVLIVFAIAGIIWLHFGR